MTTEAVWTAMNPRIKQRWITALRSGKYQQGINNMRYRQDGVYYYCCLGVLTELYIRSKAGKEAEACWMERTQDGSDTSSKWYDFASVYADGNSGSLLPPEVALWAGLLPDEQVVKDMGKPYCELTPEEERRYLRRAYGVNPLLLVTKKRTNTCAACNDGSGGETRRTFAQIANMIERTY